MTKRKFERPEVHVAEQTSSQPGEQADVQQDVPQTDSLMKQLEITRPRKRRPAAPPPEPVQLDPEFVNNPQRMQYALLLALLLRQKNGSATFAQRDLAHTDTDYNILFARTLDGRGLEVTVVSSESGIIRSPEKEREVEKWKREQEEMEYQKTMMKAFQQLPPPSTSSLTNSTGDAWIPSMWKTPGRSLPASLSRSCRTSSPPCSATSATATPAVAASKRSTFALPSTPLLPSRRPCSSAAI